MSACNCGRFEVPWCCGRYCEDPLGKIVHTETVCYETMSGSFAGVRVISCVCGLKPTKEGTE